MRSNNEIQTLVQISPIVIMMFFRAKEHPWASRAFTCCLFRPLNVTQCPATQIFSDMRNSAKIFQQMKKPRPLGALKSCDSLRYSRSEASGRAVILVGRLFPDWGNSCSEERSCRKSSEMATSMTARWVSAAWSWERFGGWPWNPGKQKRKSHRLIPWGEEIPSSSNWGRCL